MKAMVFSIPSFNALSEAISNSYPPAIVTNINTRKRTILPGSLKQTHRQLHSHVHYP